MAIPSSIALPPDGATAAERIAWLEVELAAAHRELNVEVQVRKRRLDPLMTSGSCEWNSPRHVVDAARMALGGRIALDPCAEPARSVPASRHFTAAEDGLTRQWVGSVYLNPPYGRGIGEWTGKLRTEFAEGRVTAAVALLPARTDTDWWADLDAELLCLIHGRLTFSNAGSNAPFPSVVVYLGPDAESFARAFAPLGPIFRRVAG